MTEVGKRYWTGAVVNLNPQALQADLQSSLYHRLNESPYDPTRELCISFILFTADVLAALLVISFALSVRAVITDQPIAAALPEPLALYAGLLSVLGCIIGLSASTGRYSRRETFLADLRDVLPVCLLLAAALSAVGLFAGELRMIAVPVVTAVLFPVAACATLQLAKRCLLAMGLWTLPVLIVGDADPAARLETCLRSHPALGYRVVRVLDAAVAIARLEREGLSALMRLHGVGHLILADMQDARAARQIVQAALRAKVPFSAVSGSPASGSRLTRLPRNEALLLSTRHSIKEPAARFRKAILDVTVAFALLVLFCPLLVLIALAVRLDGGPALFRHRRVGANGRHFECLKFRTMAVNGDEILQRALAAEPALAREWKLTRKLRHDPRVTRLGRFLRGTSLDELPQLLNVVRLEMSLVGPRPIVDAEVGFYGEDIAHYYATRPGVTGLWQVSGRSNITYQRRVELDVKYVCNWTLWLDILLLFKTVPAVLARSGAH